MSLVISKAVKLIDLVAAGRDTLAEIASESGMSRSTTHRLLATLVAHNYLGIEGRRYTLGYRLLELGEQKKRSLSVVDALHDVLVRYAARTTNTIHLAVLDKTDIVLLDRVAGTRQLQISSFIGMRTIACTSAVGKVLIAQNDPATWPAYLRHMPTPYPKTRAQLLDELRTAQAKNYAVDFDECGVGTCGIAASFVAGNLRAACSINGASVYFADGALMDLVDVVHEMASEMEQVAMGIATDIDLGSAQRQGGEAKTSLPDRLSRSLGPAG